MDIKDYRNITSFLNKCHEPRRFVVNMEYIRVLSVQFYKIMELPYFQPVPEGRISIGKGSKSVSDKMNLVSSAFD